MKKLLLPFVILIFYASVGLSQMTLWNQSTAQAPMSRPCQNFETAYDIYDCKVADDFTIPTGETWYIDSFTLIGVHGGNGSTPILPLSGLTLKFHSDNSGLPGTVIHSDSINTNLDPDANGSLTMHFDPPVVLTSGTYWYTASANKAFATAGQWYVRMDSSLTGYTAKWQNPSAGFATSCNTWGELTTCFSQNANYNGTSFQIFGCLGVKPVISFGEDTLVCPQTVFNLSTGASNATFQHLWSDSSTNLTLPISESGLYTVTVTDTATNCSSIKSMEVDYANPITSAPLEDDSACLNQAQVFFISACPSCSILWSTGSTLFSTTTTTPGEVSVTVTDPSSGCTESDTAILTIIDPGLIVLPGNLADLCEGSSVTLKTTLNYQSYVWWDMMTPAKTTDSIKVFTSGLYFLTVTDDFGCQAIDSILVVDRPKPTPIISNNANSNGNMVLSTTESYEAYLWSNGETTSTTIVTTNGFYQVTVTDQYGCEGKGFVSITTIGIEESISAQLKIYPNPTSNYLQVEWPAHWVGNSRATLYDATGRIVQTINVSETKQTIDLSVLEIGNYLIVTESPDGVAKSTIVVQ